MATVPHTMLRFDSGELRKPTKTPEGFMRVDGIFTRVGVFPYMQPDGTIRRELRLPEEVFSPESIASFQGVPFTNNHPPALLTPKTARKFTSGAVVSVQRVDNELAGTITVHDDAAIGELDRRKKLQLSVGYSCSLDRTPGVWNGQPYDAIQRNIRANHVALVERGRAGPSAAVRMDSMDAVMVQTPTNRENTVEFEIKMDGVAVKVDETTSQLFAKHEAISKARMDEAQAKFDAAEAKIAELSEKLAKSEAARADAEDPKRLAEAVAKRVALETRAKAACGTEFKCDGLSERELKIAALTKLSPKFDSKDKSDEYITARFDAELEFASAKASLPVAATIPAPGQPGGQARTDSVSAREKMKQEQAERWRKPLNA